MARKVKTNAETPETVTVAETPEAPEAVNAENSNKKGQNVSAQCDYATGELKITVLEGNAGEQVFNINNLPEKSQKALSVYGALKKLGTSGACASIKQKGAVECEKIMANTWEALMKGEWSARQPKEPKIEVSLTKVASNLAELSDAEKAQTAELLKRLGIEVPVPEAAA